jgi:quercetin dioxygenase-like cupin family protein
MRAERVISTQALEKPTGWHYHPCEAQWLFVMSGWIQVAFEDGSQHRLGAGGSMFIPGGYRHNEIASSADFDLLEMSIPAQLETVPCDPPDGLSADVVSIF